MQEHTERKKKNATPKDVIIAKKDVMYKQGILFFEMTIIWNNIMND